MSDLAERAWSLASRHHAAQLDKLGYPYTAHVRHVGQSVAHLGAAFEAVGYLHDIVEDCDVTLDTIADAFEPNICAGVAAMTRADGEDYASSYLARLMKDPIAIHVKFADARHNYGKIHLLPDEATGLRLRKKYTAVFEKLEACEPLLSTWGPAPDLTYENGAWRPLTMPENSRYET